MSTTIFDSGWIKTPKSAISSLNFEERGFYTTLFGFISNPNKGLRCTVKRKTLAETTGVSESTITRLIKRLKRKNVIWTTGGILGRALTFWFEDPNFLKKLESTLENEPIDDDDRTAKVLTNVLNTDVPHEQNCPPIPIEQEFYNQEKHTVIDTEGGRVHAIPGFQINNNLPNSNELSEIEIQKIWAWAQSHHFWGPLTKTWEQFQHMISSESPRSLLNQFKNKRLSDAKTGYGRGDPYEQIDASYRAACASLGFNPDDECNPDSDYSIQY